MITEKSKERNLSVPIIGISRFRFKTDGEGITTLVVFQGCPLRCHYCLNKDSWEDSTKYPHYTPEQLYDRVKVDDLYFRATGGGITFGGGEPALRADFIVAFRKLCGNDWKIRLETSLNFEQSLIEKLAPVVDDWIIDIKAYDGETYRKYTKENRDLLSSNLEYLLSKNGLNVPKEKVEIKVPVIPEYVSTEEADNAIKIFQQKYGCRVDRVQYKDNDELAVYKGSPRERDGKKICERLKEIRKDISTRYGIPFPERDCTHEGNCPGSCPLCEKEVSELVNELRKKGIEKIEISEELLGMINEERKNNKSNVDKNHPIEENDKSDQIEVSNELGNQGFILPKIQIINDGDLDSEIFETDGIIAMDVDGVPEDILWGEEILEGEEMPLHDRTGSLRGNIEFHPEEPLQGEQIPLPKPQKSEFYHYRKIFFKECGVAGVSFHVEYDDEIWNELEEGTELALVRDKNNKYDRNAIAVALANDYNGDPDDFDFDFILGYIPRSENSDLATMFDAGYDDKFSAKITTLKKSGNINSRIRITIYIESNEPQLVRPDLFRGHTLNLTELRKMQKELLEYGVAYFRFGGYPLSNYIMPSVGEKIVMFCQYFDKMVLYLTRVMAEGEECSQYNQGWGDIYNDDCIGYVLNAISGPVIVDLKDIVFMLDDSIHSLRAVEYLNNEETLYFKEFFDRVLYKIIDRGNDDMDPSSDNEKLRKDNGVEGKEGKED